ncbi:cysteine protease inhibitor [Aphelenchoides avenae]|nr:cysteine protease inhibitor [Aphelenchus avenae]
MVPGGWTDQKPDDEHVKELAHKSVHKYNKESNDQHYAFPVKVLEAKSQVVAGSQYRIKILVGKSKCQKNQVKHEEFDSKNCEETDENDRKVITATIWEKPWENFEQITLDFGSNEPSE